MACGVPSWEEIGKVVFLCVFGGEQHIRWYSLDGLKAR